MLSLKPWYSKIQIHFTEKPTDNFYKFIYHTCLRNDFTGIVIDEPSKCVDLIRETMLFKNIFYNIQIRTIDEYNNFPFNNKEDTFVYHYFCDETLYSSLKQIPCLGIYYTDNHILTNVPVNTGELAKRRTNIRYTSIEEYLDCNDYTLFLDTEGYVYYNIEFKDKVCNIFNDNIEVKLFQFVLKKGCDQN